MWICSKCSEECSDENSECWNCSNPRVAPWPQIDEKLNEEFAAFQERSGEIHERDRQLLELQFENAKRFSKLLDQMEELVSAVRAKLD